MWLDTDTFITAKDGPYAFDILPGFWRFLDQKASDGAISSSTEVYDELVRGSDDLAIWARQRRNTDLFIAPSWAVQSALSVIANHVSAQYEPTYATAFLSGADPWVIAHAMVDSGKVVTFEKAVPTSSKKVKIPNVCQYYGIESLDLYEMLRRLGAAF